MDAVTQGCHAGTSWHDVAAPIGTVRVLPPPRRWTAVFLFAEQFVKRLMLNCFLNVWGLRPDASSRFAVILALFAGAVSAGAAVAIGRRRPVSRAGVNAHMRRCEKRR